MSNCKNWVYTINNPDGGCCEPATWSGDYVQYNIWQMEVGEEGTVHYQGYVQLTQKKRISALKSQLCAHAHWEPRRGSHEQAKEYASKEETRMEGMEVMEVGKEVSFGQRSDLIKLKEDLKNGMSLKDVSDAHFGPFLRYSRAIKEYQTLHQQNNRNWATQTTVYWGPPGTGKTKRALYEGGLDAYWLPKPSSGGTVWFDGYDGHEVVVIDEFFGWIPRDLLCRMCDRYPLLVQVKGGTVPFVAKRIYITSNAAPAEWYTRIGLGPMERRLSGDLGQVIHMPGPRVWLTPEEEEEGIEVADIEMQERDGENVLVPRVRFRRHSEGFGYDSDQENGIRLPD